MTATAPAPETRVTPVTRGGRRRAAEAIRLTRGWRIFARLRSAFLNIGSILGVACLILFGLSFALDIKPTIVLSGSMEPTMPTGSLIFGEVRPAAELRIGDAITVARPDDRGLITHRIVGLAESTEPGYVEATLRGDANDSDDPYPYTITEARVIIATIPAIGFIASALQGPTGIAVLAFFLCAVIALMLLDPERIGERNRPEDEPRAPRHS